MQSSLYLHQDLSHLSFWEGGAGGRTLGVGGCLFGHIG
jgi:hypothetical protein